MTQSSRVKMSMFIDYSQLWDNTGDFRWKDVRMRFSSAGFLLELLHWPVRLQIVF